MQQLNIQLLGDDYKMFKHTHGLDTTKRSVAGLA
jgi:hypothetical protein